jgi:hypothetical protein
VTGIRFYTRQGCPLCDDALSMTRPLALAAGVEIDLIDIDLDLGLLEKYNDRVPVIEAENGDVIDEGIVDANVVREFLRR